MNNFGISAQTVGVANPVSEQRVQTPLVNYDNGSSLPSDFSKVMDSYRARSETMAENVGKMASGDSQGDRQLKQLTDLYAYSVDTQLLIRGSSQIISGTRQLMSGQ